MLPFSLKNESLADFRSSIARLARSNIYQDVKLVCHDGSIMASGLILLLAYPVLEEILDECDDDDPVVILPEYQTNSIRTRMDNILLVEKNGSKVENESSFEGFSYTNGSHVENVREEGKFKMKQEDEKFNADQDPEYIRAYGTQDRTVRSSEDSSFCTKEPKIFDCTDCEKKFTRRDNVYKHFKLSHPKGDISPFRGNRIMNPITDPAELVCKQCNKYCPSRARLKEHMKRHSDVKNFICMECGKRFKGEDGLKAHMKKHRGEYDYPCNQCDAKYVTASALLNHKTAKHNCGPQFTCEHCGKAYKNRPSYSVHLTTHTGEKPYKCREDESCYKRFRKHGARDNHERQHRGVKEFYCHLCPKEFMQKRQLVVHIKRHLGQKDHVCGVCNKAYVEAAGAKNCKHVQKVPGQETSISNLLIY